MATLVTTTLSAALDATSDQCTVASASNINASTNLVQTFIMVDEEIMEVQAVNSTTLTIFRGRAGTIATKHVSGATVVYGLTGNWDPVSEATYGVFISRHPVGAADSTQQQYSTVVDASTGIRYQVVDGKWVPVAGANAPLTQVQMHAQAATAMVDQSFFTADRPYVIVGITEIHAVAEATAGSLLIQVTKDTGTDAPGAGTDLLTNNSSTGFNGKSTANTLQTGTLVTTAGVTTLAAGNRLSVDFSASATELVGVTVVVTLAAI